MEAQMQQRTFRKLQQPHEEKGQGAEASLETLMRAITVKDQAQIAAVAYVLYEQRGREDVHDLEDWLEAERRIVSRGLSKGF